jgi:two-component system, NarL family, response regulator DevR
MTLATENPIRLLLVDDHQITRLGLRTLLGGFSQFTVVGEAGTVSEANAQATRLKPDVVVLDLRLPDGSGVETCQYLQKAGGETKVLVLTSYADDHFVFDALAAGASGYLLKEIDADSLVKAIENVAAGASVLDPSVTERVLSRLKNPIPGAGQNPLDQLSAQERRVVALVAEGKTNKEIGGQLGLSDKTVKNYLSHALDKLKLTRRSQAAALFVSHTSKPANELEAPR